jgi:hypothetical protein
MVMINYVISPEINGYVSSCNEKAKALFYCDMFEKTNLHANDRPNRPYRRTEIDKISLKVSMHQASDKRWRWNCTDVYTGKTLRGGDPMIMNTLGTQHHQTLLTDTDCFSG